jgi:hypothetical protein
MRKMKKTTDVGQKMSKEKKIPKAKLEEGITISLKRASKHLDGAEVLLNNEFLDDTVALVEFAIEEFGRAVYLRERLKNGLDSIEKAIEKDHWLKYNKAFSVLPAELNTIWKDTLFGHFPKGYWPENHFPEGYWGEKVIKERISPSTRLNAIFPYFDENSQSWQDGINIDGNKLLKIITILREHIEKF